MAVADEPARSEVSFLCCEVCNNKRSPPASLILRCSFYVLLFNKFRRRGVNCSRSENPPGHCSRAPLEPDADRLLFIRVGNWVNLVKELTGFVMEQLLLGNLFPVDKNIKFPIARFVAPISNDERAIFARVNLHVKLKKTAVARVAPLSAHVFAKS